MSKLILKKKIGRDNSFEVLSDYSKDSETGMAAYEKKIRQKYSHTNFPYLDPDDKT